MQYIVEILRKIQYVKSVPQQYNDFVERKQYLHSVLILTHTISLLVAEDLREIGVLQGIRDTLVTNKNSLKEKLNKEIHDHIFLRLGGTSFIFDPNHEFLR